MDLGLKGRVAIVAAASQGLGFAVASELVREGAEVGDIASLAVKLHKPLSARLMPVAGRRAGDRTEFQGALLVNAVLQPLR